MLALALAACPLVFGRVTGGQRYRLKGNERFPGHLATSFRLLNLVDVGRDDEVRDDGSISCPLLGIETLVRNDAADPFDGRSAINRPATEATAVDQKRRFDRCVDHGALQLDQFQ